MPFQRFPPYWQKIRSKHLDPVARFLIKRKITANQITLLSFLCGTISVYFLFQNHFLFITFALLHLIADAFDGVLARLSQPNPKGKYFDYFTDRLVMFLILIRIYIYLNDNYVLLVLSLFIIVQAIHIYTKLLSPAIFTRTPILIILFFTPLLPLKIFLTVGYLLIGTFLLYGLLLQIQYLIRIRTYSS